MGSAYNSEWHLIRLLVLTLSMTLSVYMRFLPNDVSYVPSLMLIARRERQIEGPALYLNSAELRINLK